MSAVFDFEDINRRVNRKPEPVAMTDASTVSAEAAIRTLRALGYTYTEGAEQWKPPLGKAPNYGNAYAEHIAKQYRNQCVPSQTVAQVLAGNSPTAINDCARSVMAQGIAGAGNGTQSGFQTPPDPWDGLY